MKTQANASIAKNKWFVNMAKKHDTWLDQLNVSAAKKTWFNGVAETSPLEHGVNPQNASIADLATNLPQENAMAHLKKDLKGASPTTATLPY